MSFVVIQLQPGDHGEWEDVIAVHGPFDTEHEAFDSLEPYNSSVYSSRTSPYVVVAALTPPGATQ